MLIRLHPFWFVCVFVATLCVVECTTKLVQEEAAKGNFEVKKTNKISGGAALVFAEELRQTLERHLLGQCPQTYKVQAGIKLKNATLVTCEADSDGRELSGRLAALALRAGAAARDGACSQLGAALMHALSDLARSASQVSLQAAADAKQKRKLSKSQKTKIQARQRTAIAVRKKAAAAAAAAAAKTTA